MPAVQGHFQKLTMLSKDKFYLLSDALTVASSSVSTSDEKVFDQLKRGQIRPHQTKPFDWPGRRVCPHSFVGRSGQSTGQTGRHPFGY